MLLESFDQFWARTWVPTGQPQVFELAMREIALKAWNGAATSASKALDMTDSDIRLMAGEMTTGELRTVKAVLSGSASEVRGLISQKELSST